MSSPYNPHTGLGVAVKLGRRHTDKRRPVIQVRLTGAAPSHPFTLDDLAGIPVWNGGTNFSYGTCGPCDVANSAIATWAHLLGQQISVSDNAIFDLYRRSGNPDFNPATGEGDNGVDMTVMLSALVKGGITITHPGGGTEVIKPYLFGKIALDADDLHAATSIFTGITMASTLDVAQQNQTGDTTLWDYVPGSGVWGGHATYGGAYTSATGQHALDISLVTWTARQGTTPGFIGHQLEECYVIVWPPTWEHPDAQKGTDQAAMVADYEALTGRPWTGPPPAPTPGPGPLPAPHPDDEADTAFAKTLLTQNAAGRAWVDQRHGSFNSTVAREGRAWLIDRGFASGGAPAGTADLAAGTAPNDFIG